MVGARACVFVVTPGARPRSPSDVRLHPRRRLPDLDRHCPDRPQPDLAIRFAIAVDARAAMLRALSWALVCAVLSGVAANVMAVMFHLGRSPEALRDPLPPPLIGLGEALTPAVLGMSALTVVWILITFGLRRMPKSELE